MVDPGDAGPVFEYLDGERRRLSHILITHHHADHTGGLARLKQEYEPMVYGPAGIAGVERVLTEGDELGVFDTHFRVLEVPGHTLDHIAYFSEEGSKEASALEEARIEDEDDTRRPLLFCGDTLFAAGCGRLFEGTPAMMFDSLAKLAALPAATAVYCTHEYTLANLKFAAAAAAKAAGAGSADENDDLQQRIIRDKGSRAAGRPTLPSTIGLERATNPFLRCDTVEDFAALRKWKDEF